MVPSFVHEPYLSLLFDDDMFTPHSRRGEVRPDLASRHSSSEEASRLPAEATRFFFAFTTHFATISL
jgi:hypothetical protein